MARELITSWTDYQAAIDRLLAIAHEKIRIYDENLGQLHLDASTRLEQIQRVLNAGRPEALLIALRDAALVAQSNPCLLKLLTAYCHLGSARETPEHLGHLRDNMILVDDRHALIRFDQGHARSKLLIDEPDELRPYIKRFNEIWAEGGAQIGATTLGL